MASLDDIRGSLHQRIRGSGNLYDLRAVLEEGIRQINALVGPQSPSSPTTPASPTSPTQPRVSLTPIQPRSSLKGVDVAAGLGSITPRAERKQVLGNEDDLKAKYEIKEDIELGRGATAVVKLCIERKTNAELAVKIVTKKNAAIDLEKFHEEVSILAALKHPNIIQLHDCYESDEFIYLITDLAFGGELFDRILQMKFFSEKDCQDIARKLFSATSYFHKQGIAHRDLKPENILFATLEEDSDVKISDFGFAARIQPAKKDHKGRRGTLLGTKGYAAPEIFTGLYDQKCDIWSLGVIIYIMLCGLPPFVDVGQDDQPEYTPFWVYQNKMQTVPERGVEFPVRFWRHVTPLAQEFLAAVLEADPDKRISATDALKHPWMTTTIASKGADAKSNLLTLNSEVYQKTVQALQTSDFRTINRAPFVPGLDESLKEKLAAKWDPVKAKQVQDWIEVMLGIKCPEEKTLQQWLMDGVVLCNLVNRIQSGTIKKINSGKSPFIMMENIATFLKSIQEFGIRQEDLFVTINLYEGTNMVSVVNSLFALALRCKFIRTFSGPYITEGRRTSLTSKERPS